MIPLAILGAVGCLMIGEAWLSLRHERLLRSRGAVEPAGDAFPAMQVAYPAGFVLLAIEGTVRGMPTAAWWGTGLAVLVAAKALKFWAVRALGERWSFRVLVLPGAPLVVGGPYRYLAHPNYVAVVGELLGMACLMGAAWTAPPVLGGFGWLLWRRIGIEHRALSRR